MYVIDKSVILKSIIAEDIIPNKNLENAIAISEYADTLSTETRAPLKI